MLISLIGLWVPPSELEVRSGAGAPMLAAAVLFHYSLVQSLPATGYLTHADKLMLGVYVSLLMNMITTLGVLDRRRRAARLLVPILSRVDPAGHAAGDVGERFGLMRNPCAR